MNALEQALYAKFTATSALTTAFTGGWHWDMATKGKAPPYLVAQIIPPPPATSAYGGVTYGDYTVQFKAFGVESDTASARKVALTLIEAFVAAYDEFVPTLTGATCIYAARTSMPFAMKLPVEETSGLDEAQAVVTYVYSVAP